MTIQEIKRSHQLVDTIIAAFEELAVIEEANEDPEYVTNIFMIAYQHRHTFGEQGVTDHEHCVKLIGAMGSAEDLSDAFEHAVRNKGYRDIIMPGVINGLTH